MDGLITLKSQRFRSERLQTWQELEGILKIIEGRGIRKLSDSQIIALPQLYRSTLSSLSVARSTSLDQSVIAYLESLSARAYYCLYGSQVGLGKRIHRFFAHDWPAAVKKIWRESLVVLILEILSIALAFILVKNNPDWYFAFMPEDLAGGRMPGVSTESLKETLYGYDGEGGLSVFATYLFNHNSRVAILSFALGFAFCIPTAILALYNGFVLGAFIALFSDHGLGFEVGGWLFIHGTTELFAFILASAAGFHIGKAVAFPGDYSRLEAASRAGQVAGTAMVGVIIMLLCAGLLEGFGRQLISNDYLRYGIGAFCLAMWCAYFYIPRSEARDYE